MKVCASGPLSPPASLELRFVVAATPVETAHGGPLDAALDNRLAHPEDQARVCPVEPLSSVKIGARAGLDVANGVCVDP